MKKQLVVLTGAGMSAESGIKTFRDSGGLWENHDVMTVAAIEGWYKNPELVLQFYNDRRKQLEEVSPNAGHRILAEMERDFEVSVITQNVDDLHERAGSARVVHLHGELTKACNADKTQVYDIGYRPIYPGDKAADGTQLRPFIVWFGEPVPLIADAAAIVAKADLLLIVGTSMQVYPAAGLIDYAPPETPVYVIDPNEVTHRRNVTMIRNVASKGLQQLRNEWLNLPQSDFCPGDF
ncbi:MAG: NAD-dependent protein deacylase [Tannerellaceae bacterium]|nr:NAD-dependent protein deacylase [Tannerellaceae bacterium]